MSDILNFTTATDIVKALREAEYRGYMKAVAERPQGEWIPDPDGGFRCSNCRSEEDEFIYGTGMRYVNGESEFCPNCGAKMKGRDERIDNE